jgi:hypothetical protein
MLAIAQTYLRHRPIDNVDELRRVTAEIARMNGSDAQVGALQALGRHRLSDPESLDALARLFPVAESLTVQNAIAGVLIRADYAAISRPELVQTLREHRRKGARGDDVIEGVDPPSAAAALTCPPVRSVAARRRDAAATTRRMASRGRPDRAAIAPHDGMTMAYCVAFPTLLPPCSSLLVEDGPPSPRALSPRGFPRPRP